MYWCRYLKVRHCFEIFSCLKHFAVVSRIERQVTVHTHTQNIYTKIQKTYAAHIYLICILFAHITLCYDFLYHILVNIQVGDVPTDKEKRLSKCVENARHQKDKTEKECDLVKSKAKDLKWLLEPGMEMSDEELQHLVCEVEDYQKQMEKAELKMKSTSSAFMTAHLATMEVHGVAGKVKYHERFSKKGSRDLRCMFCMMIFDSNEAWKRRILSCHWTVFEATVSFSNKCFKFMYGNAIASAYTCASIFGFFIYENMSLSDRCHIVFFVYCRGRNKQLKGDIAVWDKKIRITSWRQTSKKSRCNLNDCYTCYFWKIIIYIKLNWIHILYINAFDTVVYCKVLILWWLLLWLWWW